MRYAVVGAGALGTLFAARLARVAPVVLIVRTAADAALIARDGLIVDGGRAPDVEARHDPRAVADCDVVLVAVKTYATPSLSVLRPWVRADAPVVTLQNGAGNDERLREALGAACDVVLAPTTCGATREGIGRIRAATLGATAVGRAGATPDASRDVDRVAEFVRDATAAGIPVTATTTIDAYVWAKLVVNVAINPLTALAGVLNGAILEQPELHARAIALASETASVARALGIVLPFDDPAAEVARVAGATARNRSSMLQDREAGRPTEIDAMSGAVVRFGERAKVPTPENRAILNTFQLHG